MKAENQDLKCNSKQEYYNDPEEPMTPNCWNGISSGSDDSSSSNFTCQNK